MLSEKPILHQQFFTCANHLPLLLIREELKSRKLLAILAHAGLSDCPYQPNLDSLILQTLNLDDSDDTYNAYTTIMQRHSEKINGSNKSITKQAMKAYQKLVAIKKT